MNLFRATVHYMRHFWLVVMVCVDLEAELMVWVRDGIMGRALKVCIAKVRFLLVSESYIEGVHASLKRAIAGLPNVGPKYCLWTTFREAICQEIEHDTSGEWLTEFASLCTEVRDPWLAAKKFGFQHHQVVLDLLPQIWRRVPGKERWEESDTPVDAY